VTITAEQVERAIETPRHIDYRVLGAGWREWAPDYVIEAEAADDWDAEHAALTRWRDELAAAEPVRRVARWDGMAYALDPHHVIGEAHIVRETREEAIAWGYEIEGGPEPVDDTAPERLRERREALGWNQTWAAEDINRLHGFTEDPWGWRCVASCEDGSASAIDRTRYAAALSAAEAERAKPHMLPSFRRDIAAMRATGASLSEIADKYLLSISEVSEAIGPEAPEPAPEVVDVPQPRQPIAKLCGGVAASWQPDATCLFIDGGAASVHAPIALLRAMLEAIDAQQGGRS
jgi:hypothetical protein